MKKKGKGSTVGKKVGVKNAQRGMLQHDRKIRSKGSMGYPDKVQPPKAQVASKKTSAAARRLKDVPL
jgi:hypothetical protein